MKKLGNVLYVTTPEAYLSLDGENVVVKKDDKTSMRLPLHNLESIVCFNYPGVSPALMGACAERHIGLCFLKPSGHFLARVTGRVHGNVLLRRRQYELSDQEAASVSIARSILLGKIANSRKVIERALRDHALLVDVPALEAASPIPESRPGGSSGGRQPGNPARPGRECGQAVLWRLRTDDPTTEGGLSFQRTQPPPAAGQHERPVVVPLHLADQRRCVGAGDRRPRSYVGFLHADRPGRPSLALDLIEELRAPLADRLALSLVNLKQVKGTGFTQKESGGVLMDDATRKEVLTAWQKRKTEEVMHPYLKERVPYGLIPHVQAMLLARHMRGDLDAYPPFFWN